MTATYCPQCGLATFSKFNVYDQPYGLLSDRNMFPNARLDKNLQFCGVGDEYETNKTLTDRAKVSFCGGTLVCGKRYVKHLAKFTTRQFVMLGHTQCETLPNGGCLQAFTRKQAVDGLEYQKKNQADKVRSTSWKRAQRIGRKGCKS